MLFSRYSSLFFFFNDTATTEIYTLSLHDALPISTTIPNSVDPQHPRFCPSSSAFCLDRKSTRLNSSHQIISYAVFCLKKKKRKQSPGRLASVTAKAMSLTAQVCCSITRRLLHVPH